MEVDYQYDGSFTGLLSVIFEIYTSRQTPKSIQKNYLSSPNLFANNKYVKTNKTHSDRLLIGLSKKVSRNTIRDLYKAILFESPSSEMHIYGMIKYIFDQPKSVENDFRNNHVLAIQQMAKKVNREVHRMHAFVRFQKTKDDIYTATIHPDYDVIPLIGDHFEKRYSDQSWLIYDVKRDYGLFYDLQKVETIQLNSALMTSQNKVSRSILAEKELDFEKLWKHYFNSTNIPERKNMKLHLQHVPKRYWKYLPEKS